MTCGPVVPGSYCSCRNTGSTPPRRLSPTSWVSNLPVGLDPHAHPQQLVSSHPDYATIAPCICTTLHWETIGKGLGGNISSGNLPYVHAEVGAAGWEETGRPPRRNNVSRIDSIALLFIGLPNRFFIRGAPIDSRAIALLFIGLEPMSSPKPPTVSIGTRA